MDTSSLSSAEPAEKQTNSPDPSDEAADSSNFVHQFGKVDEQGNVWVTDGESERIVGGYPDGVPGDPFALYVRRYLDLEATINLFEARLMTLSPRDIDSTLATLTEQVAEPAAVGDLPALRIRVEKLKEQAQKRKEEIREERVAAREQALSDRTAIVDEAESIAAQAPERTQWKQSGQALRDLLDKWKNQQRQGPRLDKQTEDSLWKRFSAARTVFDRNRRQFFSALDSQQADAKKFKEKLIAEAEALQSSTEWGATAGAYRDLMDRWKQAGRASRKDDDALWARFRGAQQVFFDNRRAHDRATDAEFAENLAAKEALLAKAETILPIEDLAAAKNSLREIQDQWEDIGRVPSRDVSRVEGGLRAIEQKIREAEEKEWQRSNPETQARAQGMLSQLEDSISELEQEAAAAKDAGNSKRVRELEDAIQTKRSWLEQVRSSMS